MRHLFYSLQLSDCTVQMYKMASSMRKCASLARGLMGVQHQVHQRITAPRYLSTNTQSEVKTESINITDSCVKQLSNINDGDKLLRVLVEGGGCSGFQCKFHLDSEENVTGEDRVFQRDGVKIIVDEVSLEYIKGATVDYHKELIRSAFRVTDIPMSENGCSCGISFSLKL